MRAGRTIHTTASLLVYGPGLLALVASACSGGSTMPDASAPDGSGDVAHDRMSVDSGQDVTQMDVDASTPFDVTSVAGLVLWLEASKGVTASSGTVTAWADQSGNNNNATQNTPSSEPTQDATGINGLPAIHFAGGTHLTIADSTSLQWGTGDFYIAVVMAENNASNTAGVVFAKQEASSPFAGPALFANFPLPAQSTEWGGQVSITSYVPTNETSLNDDNARQFSLTRTGSSLSVRLDGLPDNSVVIGDGGSLDVSAVGIPVSIGASPTGTQGLSGDIAEIIAVNGTIAVSDVANIEAYLESKYSL